MIGEENYGFPPTYKLILNALMPPGKLKVVDLGCGMGAAGEFLNPQRKHEFVGIDIYRPYLDICRKKDNYKKLIKADITKMNFKYESFDVILILQVIEHLNKKTAGLLIKKAIRSAKKCVIVSVPNGKCFQENYDDSIYHKHKSSWYVSDLKKLGFKVYGQGLKIIYGSRSYGGGRRAKWWQRIVVLISTFLLPIVLFYPQIAAQIIGVKYLDE